MNSHETVNHLDSITVISWQTDDSMISACDIAIHYIATGCLYKITYASVTSCAYNDFSLKLNLPQVK